MSTRVYLSPAIFGTFAIIMTFILSGCSAIEKAENAIADVEQGKVETEVFQLNAAQAESVVLAAFSEGWPDKKVTPYEQLNSKYSIRLRFALDKEYIIVKPSIVENGVSFIVINRGTAPIVGVPARKKMAALIVKHAGLVNAS